MNNQVTLILAKHPVPHGLFAPAQTADPGVAVVYSTGTGEVKCFDGQPLRRTQAVLPRFRFRYDVDLRPHQRTARLQQTALVSRDGFRFEAELAVSFRVFDAEQVVRCNVGDALPLVYGHLRSLPLQQTARAFDIADAYSAGDRLNALMSQPVRLHEGIEIYGCRINLEPDADARAHQQELARLDRERILGDARHYKTREDAERAHDMARAGVLSDQELDRMRDAVLPEKRAVEIDSTHQEVHVEEIRQRGRLEAQLREAQAFNGLSHDLWGLLTAHIQRHPEDSGHVLQLYSQHQLALAERQDANDHRSMELFRFMTDRGLIRSTDVDVLRAVTVSQTAKATGPVVEELPVGGGWNDPLPGADGQVIIGEAAPAPQPSKPAAGTDRVAPVYVLVDESVDSSGYLDVLNEGLAELPAALARNPREAATIRLALIGYADDAVVRRPAQELSPGTALPKLQPRPGSRLAPALAELYGRIAADVDAFKAGGLAVGRPTVIVLSGSAPADADWSAHRARLTDQAGYPYPPSIVVCAHGPGAADLAGRLATRLDQAFVAADSDDLEGAADGFTAFLGRFLTHCGRLLLTGQHSAAVDQPDGFVRADRTVPVQGG